MKESLRFGLVLVLISGVSFWLGKESVEIYVPDSEEVVEVFEEKITTFRLEGLFGDILKVVLVGDGNIIVNDQSIFEGEGVYEIPLSQLPTENDLALQDFPYVGNRKSMKFYDSQTYHARGVAVPERRFFQTKEAAIGAGFVPSKNLK